MDKQTFETLEVDALLNLLARHVQTPLGRRRALALAPSTAPATIEIALDHTSECREYLTSCGGFGLAGIEDPAEALSRLQVEGASLDARQILILERLLSVAVDLRVELTRSENKDRFPRLSRLGSRISELGRLLASIRGKILPTGEIDDNATPELRRIRREIQDCRTRIHRSLESIMRGQARAVQEELVTFRNGRFVIPIRSDARGQIPGVMHGLSTSGQTSYVEPLAVIDQNNDLVRLRESEEIEIARILLEITEALRSQLPALRVAVDTIEEIDFAQAKARLAEEFSCARPQMNSERRLRLEDARHPLLEHMLRQSGSQAVPVSFEMDESHAVMVISGPNAGGKTVVLKTTGLLSLMAQMGLHVPARAAEMPVFKQVFADIGDQQSIAANLSTFTAHVRNVSEMARRVSPPALVLIDEVGTGTDPDEGAALAVAIVDYFRHAGAATIATTHYNKLKMWASQTAGVLNASVEFDERTLQPTYRLLVGIAGASSGLEIARRMAVPGEIVDQARALLEPAQSQASDYLKKLKSLVDDQETLNVALEEERRITAEKYAQLDADFARREARRRQEFESDVARVIREFVEESRRLLASINDRALAARIKKQIDSGEAGLRRSAETKASEIKTRVRDDHGVEARMPAASPVAAAAVEIGVGDRVLVRTLNQPGIVESLRGENYTVIVGSLKFRAGREELQLIEAAPGPEVRARGAERGISVLTDSDKGFSPELKVIGMAADEALDRVDKFLDQAYLADAESVRIIHGHGKGILRRAISKFLAEHPLVEGFQLAPPEQGGGGATLVSLRKE